MNTKTISQKDIKKDWILIDAADMILGRLASKTVELLRGKNKTFYSPNMDCGDNVVIINAEKVQLTGNKLNNKMYYKHTGYVGHLKEYSYGKLMEEKPEFVITKAVKGMLPTGRLGRAQIKNLKVYRGAEHKHEAQKPTVVKL